ncbi:MAG: GDSL-type esterase/lipase family protein [Pyrinomonadaceae bacterium]
MKKFVLTILLFVAAAASAAGQALYTREKEWANEINAFLEIDKKQTPPKDPIVFTGSSTIRMWTSLRQDFPNLNVMNRGFGGSRLDDLVFFAPKIVAPYKPKMIVVYSGENDIEAKDPAENALEDFKAFIAFRDKTLPKTPIVYISMKPSILRWSLWPEMKRGNDLIRTEIAKHKNVRYVDISAAMLGPNGEKPPADIFVADGLHLNAKGYAIITKVLKPFLK